MRREPEFFCGQELILVYVAKRLKEALAVEKAFDADALDYAVEATPYMDGILFRSQRVGAFFYITPQLAERARTLMLESGFKPFRNSLKQT